MNFPTQSTQDVRDLLAAAAAVVSASLVVHSVVKGRQGITVEFEVARENVGRCAITFTTTGTEVLRFRIFDFDVIDFADTFEDAVDSAAAVIEGAIELLRIPTAELHTRTEIVVPVHSSPPVSVSFVRGSPSRWFRVRSAGGVNY